MQFRGKDITIKLIITLILAAAVITAAFFSVRSFGTKKKMSEENKVCTEFFDYIKDEDYKKVNEIWPQVYTYRKDDSAFLESFSNLLLTHYGYYYTGNLKNSVESEETFEFIRIYYDFVNKEGFDNLMKRIYDDYHNEDTDYVTFLTAIGEFDQISLYKSAYIKSLKEDAQKIHNMRLIYDEAIKVSETDYTSAITLLKQITSEDTVYYPLAIEKIDEYIILLREQVKNGD